MIGEVMKSAVKYNERTVGYLAVVEEGIAFQYDSEWLKNGFSISPFSLPLKGEVYIDRKDNFEGLYGVFHDSLPDGWGELLVSRMCAKKGINYEKLNPLTKLSLIGNNGLGGLNYEPTQAVEAADSCFDLEELAEEANAVLNDAEKPVGDLDGLYLLGGSSGGARPKAHLRINGEEWIVKFPCRIDPPDVGLMEYEANAAAKKCGLDVNEFKLFPSNRYSGYFGAKRFDRKEWRRVHVVSLSSLLETTHRIPNLDYVHLFQVVENICADKGDLYEAFARMTFNVLYGNKDDHGKNFSFLYDESLGGYRLSPAYDLTRTEDKPEHEMTVMGNPNPAEKDLLALATYVGLAKGKTRAIIERIKETIKKL